MISTQLSYKFPLPTKVYFGTGTLNLLHTLTMPGKKALLVISNGKSTKTNGSLQRTINELESVGCEVIIYNNIQPNPTKENIEEGAHIAIEQKCDFIVSLGGGSVMDAGKIIALNTTNTGRLWDYAIAGTGGRKKITHKPLPWIGIPTSSGTGSEVDAVGVITNLETNEKMGIISSFAEYAIIDPELTLSIPPIYTVYQGFDALFHSMEGHICKTRNIFSDMVQETAILNIARYLPVAYRDGANLEARSRMAFASLLGGYSMVASSCAVEHSIEHALSAYHEKLPHGAGLIMISKAYYETIISQHVCDDRFIQMARLLGKEDAKKPEDFIEALLKLQNDCNVGNLKMSDYSITPDEFPDMATNAIVVMERLSTQDIKPLTHQEIQEILIKSYK